MHLPAGGRTSCSLARPGPTLDGWYDSPGLAQACPQPDVDEAIVFGRTAEKIGAEFGFATSTELDGLIAGYSVDLIDICLPTVLHGDVANRALQADRHVLTELPLPGTLDDAHRIIAAHQATGLLAFVDMFSRCSPPASTCVRSSPISDTIPLRVLEIEGRTALLWPGYDFGLDTLALDMMHIDFDLVTSLLARPPRCTWPTALGGAGAGRPPR